MKKRFLGIILSSFLALGAMIFSHNQNNSGSIAKADDLVGTPTVSWNNADYSAGLGGEVWSPNTNSNGVPQEGYCLLAQYPSDISATTYTTQNLISAGITGCNVGDYVLINGVASKNVTGVIAKCYPVNGIFIYVPHSSVAFSDEYEYVTIEVLEGMSIDGSAQTVATRFEYRGLLGSYGKWEVNPAPIEKINAQLAKIDWNNMDYSFTLGQEWCGELLPSGAPKNGYCLLAFFNEEGKSYSESSIGDVTMTGRGVLGIGLNADYKIKVNGVNIIDVADSKCYIFPTYGLFFYIPDSSITYSEEYPYPIISLEQGLHFNNVYLPRINFEFRGVLGQLNAWIYTKDASEYNHFEFNGIPEAWNNRAVDDTHNATILQYGEYGVDYLKEDHTADDTNLVNQYSDCGNKITINGHGLWEYEDAVVSYWHGYCYVYIALPLSALVPNNGYKITTLHISQNTVFWDTMFGDLYLYLFNGKWVLERPETPDDSEYESAFTFSSTFGKEQETLTNSNRQLVASKETSLSTFGLLMNYKLKTEDSAFVLYALGGQAQSGLRLVFRENTISLYDSTEGNVLLGNATLQVFSYDEWYSLFFYTRMVDNKLSIYVAIDDITYIHLDEVYLTNRNNIGNNFSIIWGSGEISLKNSVPGADNKKPSLSYSGKAAYGVLVGADKIDFSNRCSAFDAHDGDVTRLIQYVWPEGSLSTDNKINKGIWDVNIIAYDKTGNTSELVVVVIATDKLDVTVTFDGQNPVNYRVGDCIACVPDPVKEGDGVTSYRFIGWYYNDRLWDFENDYIVSDMNLVSRFQETIEEYCVSFIVEGLRGVSSYELYFGYGAKLNVQMFAKEGYSVKAYINDEEVETITVTSNMSVKLVYTSNETEPTKKKGCGGSISSTTMLIPVISGLAFVLLMALRKRGGKEHE